MIFVDSNIPMYLVGAEHPNKAASQRVLENCILRGERLVTDVEVLQEILHRYVAIDRRAAIQPAFNALLGVVDEVYPIDLGDIERARDILLSGGDISARDAIHLAVMQHRGVAEILTFDTAFDGIVGVTRRLE